jgi:hypothetical protein
MDIQETRNATVTVLWRASETFLRREMAAGKEGKWKRTVEFKLADLEPQEAAGLVALLKTPEGVKQCWPGDWPKWEPLDITSMLESFEPSRPDGYASSYYHQIPVALDEAPSVAKCIEVATLLKQNDVMVKATAETNAQSWAKHQAIVEAAREVKVTELQALACAGDRQGLASFDAGKDSVLEGKWLSLLLELDQKAREEQKAGWIVTAGSSRLQRAFAAGFDCQRLYVLERAAAEFSPFTVDFNDAAGWKPCVCPTEDALELLDTWSQYATAHGFNKPNIVWLTAAPSAELPSDSSDEDYEKPFRECEALVVLDYLGKYDLVLCV